MHELSITQGIVDICLQHAENQQIKLVVVEIGALSGIVPEAVEFCFAACTADTLAAGAALQINLIEGRGRCLECGTEQEVERLYAACSRCGGYALELLSGEELRVVEIEV